MYKGIPLAEVEDELYPDDGLPTSAHDIQRRERQSRNRKIQRDKTIRSRRRLAETTRDAAGKDDDTTTPKHKS